MLKFHPQAVAPEQFAQARGSLQGPLRLSIQHRPGDRPTSATAQRQQTIANIARVIVDRQREFLDKGIAHLKPLTMAEVAKVVGVHETTVSRAVANKYIQTPQGLFEMRYFFTSGFATASGGTLSNTSVKDQLAQLVARENPNQPFSDQELVAMLNEKGIPIARRTIAKYRGELNILPSNLRRKF